MAALQGYDRCARTLHWLIAALVIVQFVVSALMPDIGPRTQPGTLVNLHFSFGVAILAVMAVRVVRRLVHPVPLLAEGRRWQRRMAEATHATIYLFLLTAPFLGWASASAHKLPVAMFGLFTLPAIAQPKARWALTAGDVHIYMMWTLLGVVVLHVGAALYHHFIRHDGVLRRMLPGRAQV